MTIEQIKTEAKARLGKEITDEQAKEWLENHVDGKLNDEELDNVTGGACVPNVCSVCKIGMYRTKKEAGRVIYTCKKCGHKIIQNL